MKLFRNTDLTQQDLLSHAPRLLSLFLLFIIAWNSQFLGKIYHELRRGNQEKQVVVTVNNGAQTGQAQPQLAEAAAQAPVSTSTTPTPPAQATSSNQPAPQAATMSEPTKSSAAAIPEPQARNIASLLCGHNTVSAYGSCSTPIKPSFGIFENISSTYFLG